MKKVKALILIYIAILTFSGCTKNQEGQGVAQNGGQFANRRPDFGQPDRSADITGIVKSITGNEVTILKIERPNRNADSNENGNTDNNNNPENNNQGVRIPDLNGSSPGGRGFRPGGGGFDFRGGGPEGGQNGTTDRAAMLAQLEAMSTGSETVTIPVGIRMLKPDTGTANSGDTANQPQRNMVEATLADIQTDKMVNVWLDGSITDRKIAEFVLVMR